MRGRDRREKKRKSVCVCTDVRKRMFLREIKTEKE